jgi:hypothetical protein
MPKRRNLTSTGARGARRGTAAPLDVVGLNREISTRYPILSKRLRQIAEFAL